MRCPSNLCRCTGYREHRRRGARGVRPNCAGAGDEPAPPSASAAGRGSSAARCRGSRTRRWSTGRGQFVGDLGFPHQLHMRVVRSPYAHARVARRRYRGGAGSARRRRGVDRRRHRRSAADRFSRPGRRGAAPLPPAAAGAGSAALCRRAGRGGVRRPTPISPRMPPTWSTIEADELPPLLDAAAPPGSFAPGPVDRGAGAARRIRRGRCRLRVGARDRRARPDDRPAQRRAARNARRAGALRRGARHAGAVRRGQGAAPQPRRAGPHVRPQRRPASC